MTPITQFSQLDLSKTYSYADYLTWRFEEFVELIKGKVMQPMAGPSRRHQVLSTNILRQLLPVLTGNPCQIYHAPFDVRLTTTKFDLYEERGVQEYWIIYPGQNTITAWVLDNEQYQLAGEYIEPGLIPVATLPDLALEWAEIFAGN